MENSMSVEMLEKNEDVESVVICSYEFGTYESEDEMQPPNVSFPRDVTPSYRPPTPTPPHWCVQWLCGICYSYISVRMCLFWCIVLLLAFVVFIVVPLLVALHKAKELYDVATSNMTLIDRSMDTSIYT